MQNSDYHTYMELMASAGVDGLSSRCALEKVGTLIDVAGDLGREDGAIRALEWCDTLETLGFSDRESALLEYFRANAWAVRQNIRHRDRRTAWAWEQPELQKQIFHLRRTVNHPAFENLGALRQCQVLTNLGNQLNTAGRFVEALEAWERALAIYPNFAMALGNRGYGLTNYARALHDDGHQAIFLKFAHADFTAALAPQALYDSPANHRAKAVFEEQRTSIEAAMGATQLSKNIELDEFDLGGSDHEQSYRRWCLEQRLFLNPLNDLGKHAIAAQDVLTLPEFVTPVEEPPTLFGLFNQMKQEFVSARWLYYEGIHSEDVHFSDRGVLLINTLDYPVYSLAVEKVKAAYRTAYSLFDKIALFLDCYMKFGIDAAKISFRRIWHSTNAEGRRTIRPEFECSENWPLRGLFWLSRDLFEPAAYSDVT